MSNALVIIDMQPRFEPAHCGDTQAAIVEEIVKAIENDDWILLVEFESNSPTVDLIVDAIGDYDRKILIVKHDDDGSSVIHNAIHHISDLQENTHFRFVGVNFGACVRFTVLGMVDIGFNAQNISVVSRACNQPDHWEDEDFGYNDNFDWDGVVESFEEADVTVL